MAIKFSPLKLAGSFRVELGPMHDDRGYFMRVWDDELFRENGLTATWVQENQSLSNRKGLIRGLHFQKPPHSETKLVRVAAGAILDVFVDLRKDSPTYGLWDSVELSADNQVAAYVPKGFAHGFCTLSDVAVVVYKVDAKYAPGFEGGLRWDDETLNVAWPTRDAFLSAKDKALPSFKDFVSPF
jgi:dTDP-4-dehydrorhamnose 3,5-epimerase